MKHRSSTWIVAAVAGLLPLAAAAQTYRVEVKPDLDGLDVRIETVEAAGMLVVKLTNRATVKVRCDLHYDASPQTPYRTTKFVAPGKSVDSQFKAKRKWQSVTVEIACRPE
jgi:hypothetical protein